MSRRTKTFVFYLAAVGVLLMLILAWVPTLESARPAPGAERKVEIIGLDDN